MPPGVSRAATDERGAELGARTPHRFGHDFRRVSVYPPMAGVIQAKPATDTPGPEGQAERPIQRKADSGAVAADGPGRPLDARTRAALEPHFGVSFERVRVHEGPAADRSARAIDARAYTVGNDVVFADGRDRPDTPAGQRLLAHELTHVFQQRQVIAPSSGMNQPDDAFERQADRVADRVTRGESARDVLMASPESTGAPRVQRQVATGAAAPASPGPSTQSSLSSIAAGFALATPGTVGFDVQLGALLASLVDNAAGLADAIRLALVLEKDFQEGKISEKAVLHALEKVDEIQYVLTNYPKEILRGLTDVETSRPTADPLGGFKRLWSGWYPGNLTQAEEEDQGYALTDEMDKLLLNVPIEVVRIVYHEAGASDPNTINFLQRTIPGLPDDNRQAIIDYIADRLGPRAQEDLERLAQEGQQVLSEESEESAPPTGPGTPPVAVGAVYGPGFWMPGKIPKGYYIGSAAHIGVASYYTTMHLGEVVFANFIPISSILTQTSGMNPAATPPSRPPSAKRLDGKPDIANMTLHHLYEIKPAGSESLARSEANWYRQTFLMSGVPMDLGPTTDAGVNGVFYNIGWYFVFSSPEPGVVVYRRQKSSPIPVPVPSRKRSTVTGEEPASSRRFILPAPSPSQQAAPATAAVVLGILASLAAAAVVL